MGAFGPQRSPGGHRQRPPLSPHVAPGPPVGGIMGWRRGDVDLRGRRERRRAEVLLLSRRRAPIGRRGRSRPVAISSGGGRGEFQLQLPGGGGGDVGHVPPQPQEGGGGEGDFSVHCVGLRCGRSCIGAVGLRCITALLQETERERRLEGIGGEGRDWKHSYGVDGRLRAKRSWFWGEKGRFWVICVFFSLFLGGRGRAARIGTAWRRSC